MADVGRRPEGQRHRQEHRVERRLERSEEQRHEAQLRLIVLAAGALPGVDRLVVALVLHFAEERLPTDFRMGAKDAPCRQAAVGVHSRHGVPAKRHADLLQGRLFADRRHVAFAGHVVHGGDAVGVEAQQRLVSRGGDDFPHRRRMGLQGVDQPQLLRTTPTTRRCGRRTRW